MVGDSLGFGIFSLHAVLTCIVKCGKCLKPCVVSMTTLSFLMKFIPTNDSVNFFNTTNCSAKMLSPIQELSLVVANGFPNWPFVTCLLEVGVSSTSRRLIGTSCFIVSNSFRTIALI